MAHFRNRTAIAISVVAGLAIVSAGCVSAPARPTHLARGDYDAATRYAARLVRHQMIKHDIVGFSVALVDDQRVVWARGFGYADRDAGIAATPETLYRVGSIAKLFTATAAMQLAEQGKLDIDRPLQAYIPEFSIKSRFPGAGAITPRMLMTHHSGLPGNVLKGLWVENPEPIGRLVHEVRGEYVAHPPNYVFSYSNLAPTLLGHALERITGAEFAAHLRDAVLLPLGMSESSFSARPDPRVAKGYRNDVQAMEPTLRDVPAGGLNSNVRDLSRFLAMIFAGGKVGEQRLLGPDTVNEMLRPQNADVALDMGFHMGLGWMMGGLGGISMDIENAGPVVYHGGTTLYHRSMLMALPEHKLGVVVLSNTGASLEAVNRLAMEILKIALEVKTGIQQPQPPAPDTSVGKLAQADIDAFAGYYATAFGMVQVRPGGGSLRADAFGSGFDLVPRIGGYFGVRYRLFGLFPIEVEPLSLIGLSRARVSDREVLVVQSRGQKMLAGEKITPSPIPDVWLKRTGDYEIANGDTEAISFGSLRLRTHEGFLVLDVALRAPTDATVTMAIAPVSNDEAVIQGIGRGAGETIHAVIIDGEEYFRYAGYLARKKSR